MSIVDVEDGQKTGFFLDQKYNRLAVQNLCRNLKPAKVLDCFTHTGSFALNAGIAGSEKVLGVDASQLAVDQATENARLNGLEDHVTFQCADVFDLLPKLDLLSYSKMLGLDSWQSLDPCYFGLNHFGWFTALYDKEGKDRLPELREMILTSGMSACSDKHHKDKDWQKTWKQYAEIVKDYPDFLPNSYLQYYLYSSEMVAKMDINRTRADMVIEGREQEMFAEHKKYLESPENYKSPIQEFTVFGDFIVDAAASIAYNKGERFLVIVENNGAIPNMPADAMVEVPAYIRSWGPEPVSIPPIPTFHKGMMENQLASEKLAVDAYFENSYDKALQAIAINKTVPSTTVARKILDDLIEANGEYWPTLK